MKLNTLARDAGSRKARRRVGRGPGSGLGTTCGRGQKGQKSRAGARVSRGFEGGQMPLQMRLPKYGFSSRIGRVTEEVRLDALEKMDVVVIDIAALKAADVIGRNTRRAKVVKTGAITRSVTLRGIRATRGAREAIEAAGGGIEQ